MPPAPILILQGPTASGKSRLALALAATLKGRIINADSMQLYQGIETLTAQPRSTEMAQAPHRLYRMLGLQDRASAGQWAGWATREIADAQAEGQVPILVGGTGLYIKVLLEGIAPIPPIPDTLIKSLEAQYEAIGSAAFYEEACVHDSEIGSKVKPNDRQRLIRALSVMQATGRSLFEWQEEGRKTPQGLASPALVFTLWPERSALYAACDQRFLQMLRDGAMEEAQAIAGLDLDPALPAMKALGLPMLLESIRGKISQKTAIIAAQQATRRYAKRQMTWFRHQMPQAIPLSFDPRQPKILTDLSEQILRKWQENLLTGT